MQALLFGVSHGYQGLSSTVKITIYGGLFGLLAVWRRSLRPGIAAHVLTDILAIL
jgi:membrane protease YdiL (CAAX protease family)